MQSFFPLNQSLSQKKKLWKLTTILITLRLLFKRTPTFVIILSHWPFLGHTQVWHHIKTCGGRSRLPIKMNEQSKCCKERVPGDSHPEVIICEETRYILFRQKPRSALLYCIKASLNLCHCPPGGGLTAAVNSTQTLGHLCTAQQHQTLNLDERIL